MDELSRVLTPACVRLGLQADSVRQVLAEAAQLLASTYGLRVDVVADALWQREQLASTAIGLGVALPHARIPGLLAPHAAYLRLASPLAFDAPDDRPVTDVFVLLVPERAQERHLQLLAGVAACFAHPPLRESLHRADHPQAVCRLLSTAAATCPGV